MFQPALRLAQDALLQAAARCPGKEALVADDSRVTYGELLDRALGWAHRFRRAGLRPGDRVTLFMPNGVDLVLAFYGTWLAGGIAMVVNPQTKAEKLAFLLEDSGARILATLPVLEGAAKRALAQLPGPGPTLLSGEQPDPGCPPLDPGRVATDLALLIYTSGSSGHPKGVMLTHQNITFTQDSLIEYLRLGEDDRILNVLPLAFDYGLYQLLMAVRLGATLVLEPGFNFPAQIEQRILEEGVTVVPGVPTLFATLTARAREVPKAFPGVRRVTNTAAALAGSAIPALQALFPEALVFKMYGLTECKRVSYLEPEELARRPESVGKAIPGTQVFLLDPEGHPVGPGGTGILHVRGPHVMVGYWNRPDLTAEMLRTGSHPADRVLCTQDLLRMDEEGFLYFLGRRDDIIKSRGEKVSPVEVERVLLAMPGVKDAVVLGLPDPVLGEAIHACLSAGPGTALGEPALRRFCQERLENFMVPQVFHIFEDLPKGGNGKIMKRELIELIVNK